MSEVGAVGGLDLVNLRGWWTVAVVQVWSSLWLMLVGCGVWWFVAGGRARPLPRGRAEMQVIRKYHASSIFCAFTSLDDGVL